MDVKAAQSIADRLLGKSDKAMNVYDSRIDVSAFALTDNNHDFQVDRRELIDALVAGRIKEQDGKLIPARAVEGLAPASNAANQGGLAPANWTRGAFVPGGDPAHPPMPVRIVGSGDTVGANNAAGTLTNAQIDALKNQSFATVSSQVTTPEDVANLLGRNISYDNDRLKNQGLNLVSESADEVLAKGTGICRDQHALARDILKANGYDAVLLGYSGSDQSHAIAAYKDKKTGEWGIVEYGTLYPPSQLHAKTPEEALMMVRPTAMAISIYSDEGHTKENHTVGIFYTPTSRVYEQFMSGPAPTTGTGVTMTNQSMDVTAASSDHQWQAGMKIVTDPRLPYLQGAVMVGAWHTFGDSGFRVGVGGGYVPHNTTLGVGNNVANEHAEGFGFVSAEEFHPEMLHFSNIGGSGINVDVGSHTTLQAVAGSGQDKTKNKDEADNGAKKLDIEGYGTGLSSLKWNPSVTVSKDFSVWNRGTPDTRLSASYGIGVDAGLLAAHYASGGTSLPINQYATAGVETHPTPWLGLSAQGYMPITNHTNDFAASPMVRIAASTPYATVATTQGKDQASYEASTGVMLPGHVQLGAFASVTQDRLTGQTDARAGGQLTVMSW